MKVDRESVAATDTDFSSIVTNVGSDVNVVVFATQTASAAQTLSNQLREQGKKAVVFGTDGAYSPSQYKPKTRLRLRRSRSICTSDKCAGGIRRRVQQVLEEQGVRCLRAAKLHGCVGRDGRDQQGLRGRLRSTRAEVTPHVQKTNIPSILGGSVRFTKKGDAAPHRSSRSTRSRTGSTRGRARPRRVDSSGPPLRGRAARREKISGSWTGTSSSSSSSTG